MSDEIRIADYPLISLLRYFGFTPVSIDSEYGKVYFTFESTPQTQEIVKKFELGQSISINVAQLFLVAREVKGQIMRSRYGG